MLNRGKVSTLYQDFLQRFYPAICLPLLHLKSLDAEGQLDFPSQRLKPPAAEKPNPLKGLEVDSVLPVPSV
jgi:hypothetical protein